MTAESSASPARILELLWRDSAVAASTPAPARRGRKADLDTSRIVRAALDLADAEGADAVSIRRVAAAIGAAPMSLYTHVPDKAALIALMTDAALLGMTVTEPAFGAGWRERLSLVAGDNRTLLLAHPWMLELRPERPPLGPGVLAKYEWELSAFRGLGLSAFEMDSTLTFLLEVVRGAVADAVAARSSAAARGSNGDDWWTAVGPVLERFVTEEDFPLAIRVGAEAGAVLGARYDADHAFDFGLARVLDAIAALVAR